MTDISFLIAYTASFSMLIPFVAFFFLKKKDSIIRTFFIWACVVIVTEIGNEVYVRTGHRGLIIYNLSYILQFVVVSYGYHMLLGGRYARFIGSSMVLFLTCFVTATLCDYQPLLAPQNWIWGLGNVILITYGVCHFFYLRTTVEQDRSIYIYRELWINLAFLVYFTYSLAIFLMANQILIELKPATSHLLWNLHNVFYVIRNLLLAYSFHKTHNTTDIDWEKWGEKENWRDGMQPNPNL